MTTAYAKTPRPATLSVAQAARLLGIGRSLAYELARWRGELAQGVPVLHVGDRRYVVPTRPLAERLGLSEDELFARLAGDTLVPCRYCNAPVEPIETLLDGEKWWRCPHCGALLEKAEGRRR